MVELATILFGAGMGLFVYIYALYPGLLKILRRRSVSSTRNRYRPPWWRA